MIFKKYDFYLQKNRDKMLWTDRDLALVGAASAALGFIIGYLA